MTIFSSNGLLRQRNNKTILVPILFPIPFMTIRLRFVRLVVFVGHPQPFPFFLFHLTVTYDSL